jgi:prepilin-type N-terminal cleavage/methylation domain-containing protein
MVDKILKNQKGITLLELIVAVGIFSVVILAATGIFQAAMEGQRSAIAAQNLQESMRYAFEVMSKEIRMAQKSTGGDCGGGFGSGKIYKTKSGNDELNFKNYNGECVKYRLNGDRLEIERNSIAGFITPDEIKVSNLKFSIVDNIPAEQSKVTMKMDIETAGGKDMHKQRMTIQTSVSARYYE